MQVAACAPYPESLRRGEPVPADVGADDRRRHRGQAPRRAHARRCSQRWADDIVVVGEDETAEAMVVLMERCKLVVEGAGAVGVAALLGGQVRAAPRGHDGRGALRRQRRRRRCWPRSRAATRPRPAAGWCCSRACPTGPATSPGCSTASPASGANIVDVSHVREGVDLHVRETAVELVLETRGQEHADAVVAALNGAGYDTRVVR